MGHNSEKSRRDKVIDEDLVLKTEINIDYLTGINDFMKVLTREPVIASKEPHSLIELPANCMLCCKNCQADIKYTINEIKTVAKIGQTKIREELFSHGHPKTSFVGKGKKKKYATTEQQRDELIQHLLYKHS